ncbi:MAG: OsmC family protein [Flavobacteriaceae bacterium]|nr:OsmC family protein [Flavobacteriaceae bacterium]
MNIDIKFNETGKIIPSYNGKEITMDESPYMIYLATTGMCSAVYVRAFLMQRGMSLENVKLTQIITYNRMTNMVENMEVKVDLPDTFPTKYNKAIKATVDQCPVKKHMVAPPTVLVTTNLDVAIEA